MPPNPAKLVDHTFGSISRTPGRRLRLSSTWLCVAPSDSERRVVTKEGVVRLPFRVRLRTGGRSGRRERPTDGPNGSLPVSTTGRAVVPDRKEDGRPVRYRGRTYGRASAERTGRKGNGTETRTRNLNGNRVPGTGNRVREPRPVRYRTYPEPNDLNRTVTPETPGEPPK
uniref:Putative ribosomal protein l17 n=1 Tax=Ixodes ricinus TaxID=34613 RepID=A0A0K8RH11_IXORI